MGEGGREGGSAGPIKSRGWNNREQQVWVQSLSKDSSEGLLGQTPPPPQPHPNSRSALRGSQKERHLEEERTWESRITRGPLEARGPRLNNNGVREAVMVGV